MQDLVAIAALLREISFGILIAGIFYTFGLFALGRVFGAILDHGEVDHDIDHDIDHDVDHDMEHDVGHDFDHDIGHEIDHDIDHDIGHELDHDMDHDVGHELDHDVDHEVDHDMDHDADHDMDHGVEIDHDIDTDKSGFFEIERGAPLGVSIGTALVVFGFLGSILYYEGILIPLVGKIVIHVAMVAGIVYAVRIVLSRAFVESGFMIEPRHIVGKEVEAVSTINDGYGEVRLDTEMGLRRFHARPFQKGVAFAKGTGLFVVSADDKFVYVDPRKDVVNWLQKQSKSIKEP
ncbi:MAG: hypothetical protein ACFFCP_10915 [Promethearchaeota archaeon]